MSDKLVTSQTAPLLSQDLNFWQVFLMGLRAMIGAGAFVGVGIGASIAGLQIIYALALAAIITLCNGFSQIQLATTKQGATVVPLGITLGAGRFKQVGQDIYGYSDTLLNSWLGFAAAWGLALSQAAAAATVALGLAGYLLNGLGWRNPIAILPVALLMVGLVTVLVHQGVRFAGNWKLLGIITTLATLSFLIVGGLYQIWQPDGDRLILLLASTTSHPDSLATAIAQTLRATSLMTIAYAGYGRITQPASRDCSRSSLIKALLGLTVFTLLLYTGVSVVTLGMVSSDTLMDAVETFVAPLQVVAQQLNVPASRVIATLGALVALFGMLHYLSGSLARSLWIMGLRRDLPEALATLHPTRSIPTAAVTIAGVAIASLVLAADVTELWAFSAFAFLIYAAITNLAAFHLSRSRSLRWIAKLGGVFCLVLIFCLEWQTWIMGAGLIVIGLIWRGINLWVTEQTDHQD